MKQIYRIPVTWEMWGVCDIEAESLEEAKAKVFDCNTPLPENPSYIDDTIQIDEDGIGMYNEGVEE